MNRFRGPLRSILKPFKGTLERLFEVECSLARRWSAAAHRRLMIAQWAILPSPEHFDHHIDLFHQWLNSRNSLWLERGAFGSLALKGGRVLELACGDGFNARNFYSLRSAQVVAVDFDVSAIRTARGKNSAPNVEFVLADIRTSMPEGEFDNVVWDAAIEHFTPDEIAGILTAIGRRLSADGVLSGYTLVEGKDGRKHIDQHEYEFRDKEDLVRFLTPHFRNVCVFETIYPSRHNLYFWASNGAVPFSERWPAMVRHCSTDADSG